MSRPTSPIPDGPPPKADPRRPALALPPGASDGHCHIFGPFDRFLQRLVYVPLDASDFTLVYFVHGDTTVIVPFALRLICVGPV